MIKFLLLLLTLVVYIPLNLFVSGYTLSTLWNWFIVVQFPSMPNLTIIPAMGIGLVVAYMTHQTFHNDSEDKSTSDRIAEILAPFLRSGMALLIGYIIKFHLS